MSRMIAASLATLAIASLATAARAETNVTVSETHLCCGQCLKGVEAALKDVKGVTQKSDQGAKTIAIVAENDEAAQKAIDALAAAGFYGKTDNQAVKYKTATAASGTVEKAEVSGLHNCCGQCTTAIKKAVTSVSGVTGTSVKNKETTFTVEGKFSPSDLQAALLKAGFNCQVK